VLAREVRNLALPAILHSLLQTLVFVVDRIMLGAHGEASLAAMQLGGALEWSVWSVFAAFEVGTIARVGRHVGAKDPALARRAAIISLSLAAAIGTLLTVVTPLVLVLLPRVAPNASAASIAEAQAYLSVTLAASPLVFLAMTAIATLQAGGDTRTPLAIGILANVVHVGTNAILIPRLGARGAGISTATTFVLEAVLAILALTSVTRPVSLRGPRAAGPVRDEARELARIAMPAFLERVLYHVGYVGYVLMIASLGEASMAANQSLISVESICFLSADGFGIAAAALVAQKLGANRPDDARRAAWIATRYSVIALTVFGLTALALRDVILPVFTKDPHVITIGRDVFWVLAIAQPFMGAGIVLAQSLRGAGRTREALLVSIVGAVVVRLTATYVFGIVLGFGLVGIWMGSTVDWIVRSVLLGLRQRSFPRVREEASEG
jgi:multidrug resistance protein, MATE family